jgi:hypothetical protein
MLTIARTPESGLCEKLSLRQTILPQSKLMGFKEV